MKDLKWMIEQIRIVEDIVGWGERMDAKLLLIRSDPELYYQAARKIVNQKVNWPWRENA